MITIGMDYYPEQWDASVWEEDIQRMRALGVKVVRIGEFAWSRLEPAEGVYRFAWMDRIIDLIGRAGMKVILGTPTSCPPLWLYEKHPETLQCERDGRRTHPGIRGHRCMTSPVFREYAGDIVRRLAGRYADREEVYAWQIDNELESSHCTCPSCAEHFRSFLKEKYGTLEALNRAWGTSVWSGEISGWGQIHPFMTGSGNPPDWYNPAYMLDYERFCSKSTADYAAFQAAIIREVNPAARITTNSCFSPDSQNFREEYECLDVAAYDNYPAAVLPEDPGAHYSNAYALDRVRSWKKKNFWILEELGGPLGCWGPVRPSLEPGMLEGYALQAVAHGADLLSFFRWRTAVSGAEMFCYGLLDHDNRDNRYIREFAHLVKRLEKLPELDRTGVESRVAILFSPDNAYAFRTQQQSEGFKYETQLRLFHEACMNLGVNADIVKEEDDLAGYRVLIIPAYAVTDPAFAKKAEAFVQGGGTAVLTCRTGVKDIHGNCIFGRPLPAYFEKLCGVYVKETDAIGTGRNGVIPEGGAGMSIPEYPAAVWCDLLEPEGAEVIGRYSKKFYRGTPAVTRNRYGRGSAWYIGTVGDRALYRDLLIRIFEEQKIPCMPKLPAGVECTERTGRDAGGDSEKSGKAGKAGAAGKVSFRFYFNNTMKPQHFPAEVRTEEGTGEEIVEMRPLEMKILRNERDWV